MAPILFLNQTLRITSPRTTVPETTTLLCPRKLCQPQQTHTALGALKSPKTRLHEMSQTTNNSLPGCVHSNRIRHQSNSSPGGDHAVLSYSSSSSSYIVDPIMVVHQPWFLVTCHGIPTLDILVLTVTTRKVAVVAY